ncbi:hypothetical protein ACQ4PT_012482 [Festuca glaucescens]
MSEARGFVNLDFNLPYLQTNFQGTSQVRSAEKFSEFKMSSADGEMGAIKENDEKQSETVGIMGSTDVQMGEIKENDEKHCETVGNAQMGSTDVEMSESQENDMKQNETEGSAEMSSTAGDVGEVKENDDKHSDMVGSAKMSSTIEEVGEIKEDDNNQSDMVGCAQMSSTDGDMGEITENDVDDTKKYIMSFPPKTKLVRIDDACLRRNDFEECLFPDDGWLDGDDGLKLFRKQLPYILLNTDLNILKGRPELPQPDQKGEASDVLMWEGVADTSNGGEPTDRKERNRQCRQNYAQMDPQKKDELLKKRRESYQQKKAKLQSTQSVTGTRQSALTQLESTPAVKGATATNTENVAPAENEAYQLQSPHMSSQWQESLVTVNKENEVPSVNKKNEVPSVNKENEVPYKDDEWLRRNDNYQRQSIPIPFQGPEIIPTDVIATYCTQESHGGPSALCQLESTPDVKGDTARDKENLVPDDNDALHMQLPHMSSQGQGSLVTAKTVNKETEVPLAHKENEVHSQDDEWLRRNDNYQMQSIPMLLQGQEIIPTDIVDMENCNSNEPTSSRIQPQPVVDSTEKKKKRERERYAQMNIDSKNELLAKRHATYQQKRLLGEHIEKRRAKDRLLYAAMSPKKKRSKKARQELRRNSLNEESIAMENPCWIPEVVHTPDTQGYIPTCDWHIPEFSGTPIYIEPIPEQMSGEVTPDIYFSNKSRRKHVTPGERHALLGLRNEAFYANSKKHAISSADENPSMSMEGVNGSETPTQSAVVNNETTPPTPEIVQQLQTQSPANDDREDEGVILEEDSEDEEGYMFAGQGNLIMF